MMRRIAHSAPSIGDAEVRAAERVLRSGHLAQGAEVAAFEEECAGVVGRRYAVAVNSGTAALHLALAALGIQDEQPVAMPAYACAALLSAIHLHNARPWLCDVTPNHTLDASALPEDARAAIAVHLFGAPAAIPAGTSVVEDIAQSIGGGTGSHGQVAVASFYATKLVTTGEGGMVFTDDEGLAEFVRDRRDYDNRDDFIQRYNYKMTDLQAAIGREQLRRLPAFIAARRAIAARYNEAFAGLPVDRPADGTEHVYFRYVIGVDERERLEGFLGKRGIEAKRPVYRPAHHYLGGDFPRAERAHRRCLSLPIYPKLVDTDVAYVIESVQAFWGV
ncbi:MAG: DegT/DnrJ/EryC1/StrS family aminotransferase [Candidatus Hydrogenedentota bacterium]